LAKYRIPVLIHDSDSVAGRANAWLGKEDTILTGIVFLLLLSVSAATVGSLVFGYPIFLFLDGKKREALQAIIMTIGLLLVETIVAIGVVSIIQ
jgi:hypothetical protein